MSLFVRDRGFYRTFFTLASVVTLQQLIIFGVSLADNVMLGMYSQQALSGANLAIQIQFILQMLVLGLADGTVIMGSRYWGRRDLAAVKEIGNIAIKCGLIMSVVLWLTILFYGQSILSLFTYETAIVAEGTQYIRIICFSYVVFTLTNILLATLRCVEVVKIGFVLSCFTFVVNVFLNYVLIYGNFGAPELGIKGAAIATLTARIVEFIIIVIYLKYFDKHISFVLSDFLKKADLARVKTFFKISLPVVMSNFIWGMGMAMQTAILGHLGAAAIAANSIVTALYAIISVGMSASVSASVIVLGKTLGEERLDKFKEYAKTLQFIYIGVGVVTGLILYSIRGFILSLYVAIDPQAYQITMQFLTVLSVTVMCTSYEWSSIAGIIRGAGNTRFMVYNDFFFMWIIVLPLSYVAAFIFEWQPVYVFMCLKCDQVLKCFQAFYVVNRFRYIKKLH